MKTLEGPRVSVRAFRVDDLSDYRRLISEAFGGAPGDPILLDRLRYFALADIVPESLGQPSYGDRAICLREDGRLIGSVGLVPALAPFGQLPSRGGMPSANTAEVGLFWALLHDHRGRGFATEAAHLLIAHAFGTMHVARMIATTEDDNTASIAVMKRLGMTVERNHLPGRPAWFQTVGWLDRAGG